ncbi:MAG: signal peptidase II [Candidatus Zixiibacteriota bacterium]
MPASALNANRPRRQLLEEDNRHLYAVPLIILLMVVAIDQLTKSWAMSALADLQTVSVLGQFFRLKLVYNTGGALGTELGSSTFYLISSFLILAFVIYFVFAYRHIKLISYAMAAIAGGAIGNIIDRLQFGKVVDFIDFDFFDINLFGYQIERWWIFNIADSAITIGIIFLAIYILFQPKMKHATDEINNSIKKSETFPTSEHQ